MAIATMTIAIRSGKIYWTLVYDNKIYTNGKSVKESYTATVKSTKSKVKACKYICKSCYCQNMHKEITNYKPCIFLISTLMH